MDGITLEKLQVIIEAQTAPFKKQLSEIKEHMKRTTDVVGRETDKLSSKFSLLANKIKTAFLAIATSKLLIDFGKAAIHVASQLQEVQNVVDVAFGSMSYKIENFAKTALDKFGLSELAAKKTASTFMAMGVGMGFSSEKASNMAIQITGLSGDMASFYNISQDMASTALKSIWTGETEVLKNYGIAMTQANLQQYAYQQGINKSISSMTQAEQVTLRYMYVTNALSLAQGDFARTSGSWANQVKLLNERFRELLAIIGGGLIKVFTPVIQVINAIISKILLLAKAIQTVLGRLFGSKTTDTSKAIDSVGSSSGKATKAQNGYAGALKKTEDQAKKTANALLGIDELNVLSAQDNLKGDTGGGGGGLPDGVGGGDGFDLDFSDLDLTPPDDSPIKDFADRLMKYFEPLKNINFDNLDVALGKLGTAFGKIGKSLGAGLEWLYFNILIPLTKWTIEDALPAFLGILSGALEVLNSVLNAIAPLIDWLWDSFLQPIAEWTGGVIVDVLKSIEDALYKVSDWIDKNKGLIETFVIILGSFAVAWNLVMGALNLVHTAGMIYNTIISIGTALTTAFGAVLAFITSPIGIVVVAIGGLIAVVVLLARHWDTVKEYGQKAWDGLVNIFSGAGAWFETNVATPVVNIFKSLANGIGGFFEGVINGVIGAFEGFVNFFTNGINTIIGDFNDLSQYIGFTINPFTPITLGRISVPKFANGGIVSGPTIGLMGEYAGASSNPEVISPLNKLKSYIKDDEGYFQRDVQIDLLKKAIDLLEKLLSKNTNVELNGRTLNKGLNNPDNSYGFAISTGL